jgi:hypothetical protein
VTDMGDQGDDTRAALLSTEHSSIRHGSSASMSFSLFAVGSFAKTASRYRHLVSSLSVQASKLDPLLNTGIYATFSVSSVALFRATRIPIDHPSLRGRNLKPPDPQPAWSDLSAAI